MSNTNPRANIKPRIILVPASNRWEVAYIYTIKWANYNTWTTHEALSLHYQQVLTKKLYNDLTLNLVLFVSALDEAEIDPAYGRVTRTAYTAMRSAFAAIYATLGDYPDLELHNLPPAVIPAPLIVETTQPDHLGSSGFHVEFSWRFPGTIPDLDLLPANLQHNLAVFQTFLDRPFRNLLQPWAERLRQDRPLTAGECNDFRAALHAIIGNLFATVKP